MDTTRKGLLNPVDRISEILFGLIMALTIVGSLSVATAGAEDVRVVMMAALGCNLAWGLVDAVMYLMRTLTDRTRGLALAQQILKAPPERANALVAATLPDYVAALCGPAELEGMRRRLSDQELRPGLHGEDYLAALGAFLLVVIATFPIVLPFIVLKDTAVAMEVSRGLGLAMLFAAGLALGRYAGHPRPLNTGLAMGVLGAALIVAVKALGG